MVTVYFQTPKGSYSEKVATFQTEELYMICSDTLQREASKRGMIITESVN